MHEVEKLIRETSRLHFTKMRQVLSLFNLGKGQPPILKYLSENSGCKQSEISKRECVTPATTTVMLQTMEKNGLIERRSDESDLRIMRVYITEKGRETINRCDEEIDKMEDEIYEVYSEEEYKTLIYLLKKMKARLRDLLEMEETE